jgi:hypothetical protein
MTTSEATTPAFTPEYWERAPRKLSPKVPIVNINNKDDWKHIQLANGATLRHPQSMIKQLLTVGTVVQAQFIKTAAGEVVTGCYLPQLNAWAWQLTAQDLADQVKALSVAAQAQAIRTHERMVDHVAERLERALIETWTLTAEDAPMIARDLATVAVEALEKGPQ